MILWLQIYFGFLVTQWTLDVIPRNRLFEHQLRDARITEEMQTRQHTGLDQLIPKKKTRQHEENVDSSGKFVPTHWQCLQFSSLLSVELSKASTAISSPLPLLKVSPLNIESPSKRKSSLNNDSLVAVAGWEMAGPSADSRMTSMLSFVSISSQFDWFKLFGGI